MTEPAGDAPIEAPSPPAQPVAAIWDLPVRLFHWALAALVALSWYTAENHLYDLHLWSGLGILSLLFFRLFWGLFGSSTARFAGFVRGPRAVRDYLAGRWRGIGHSPLGALSVVALLAALFVQAGLGLFASDEDGLLLGPLSSWIGEDLSGEIAELHDSFFNVLLALIALHLAAVLFYVFVRKRPLIRPMLGGKGPVDPGIAPMRPGKWWIALLSLVAGIALTRWILAGAPPFGP